MSCTDKKYNPHCLNCQDVDAYCSYAEKEGIADLQGYTWEDKKSYYAKGESYEPDQDRDWGAEEYERQEAMATGN